MLRSIRIPADWLIGRSKLPAYYSYFQENSNLSNVTEKKWKASICDKSLTKKKSMKSKDSFLPVIFTKHWTWKKEKTIYPPFVSCELMLILWNFIKWFYLLLVLVFNLSHQLKLRELFKNTAYLEQHLLTQWNSINILNSVNSLCLWNIL